MTAMNKFDPCKYADPFYGNGATDRFFDDGLASKWFYIKALCGNTIPHATLPFGKISVGAYSGGYPTGYGMHRPNSSGGIEKLGEEHLVKGFSHLHQSGTGAIQYYYNYAVATPFYGDDISEIKKGVPISDEIARPGYYSARLGDISCEMTVDGGVALHRYTFGNEGGKIAVDFSNDGLDRSFGKRYFSTVKNAEIKLLSENEAAFCGEFSGIKLYFSVKIECEGAKASIFSEDLIPCDLRSANAFGIVFDFKGKNAVLRVGYSTLSEELARAEVHGSRVSFDEAREKAYAIWGEHLGAFTVHTEDEELRRKFYSNLYHSLVKPSDMYGEGVLGTSGQTVTDFATFWDQYKTALPLIFTCYKTMGERMVNGIASVSRALGRIPCSFGLSTIFPCEEQAKMLGILSLCDAYHLGYPESSKEIIRECITRELAREDYADFLKDGRFERYTHILDATDACLCVAEITDDERLKERLLGLAKNWTNAYGEDGLMSEESRYYEGDRYTYSFRIQKNMEERVDLAGGKERFARLLDDFFGFGKDSVKQLTYVGAGKDIAECRHHRFEGFNNECDMEAPYAYIYADRHDRLAEIMSECVNRSFGSGRSGLPGNNDSGGLSSLFIWNALGIFPVSGSGIFLIGSPAVDGADIRLFNGKTLSIRVFRESREQIYLNRVELNGKEIKGYSIGASELMQGGELCFYMR